uniref:Uncharacterized protein n=1 Tax=Anguilla anguilla TaxID=7936 RepID=A0A0E9VD56_ANGAN
MFSRINLQMLVISMKEEMMSVEWHKRVVLGFKTQWTLISNMLQCLSGLCQQADFHF